MKFSFFFAGLLGLGLSCAGAREKPSEPNPSNADTSTTEVVSTKNQHEGLNINNPKAIQAFGTEWIELIAVKTYLGYLIENGAIKADETPSWLAGIQNAEFIHVDYCDGSGPQITIELDKDPPRVVFAEGQTATSATLNDIKNEGLTTTLFVGDGEPYTEVELVAQDNSHTRVQTQEYGLLVKADALEEHLHITEPESVCGP